MWHRELDYKFLKHEVIMGIDNGHFKIKEERIIIA